MALRMTPVLSRGFVGQWLVYCTRCNWKTVQINEVMAERVIAARDAHCCD